MGVKPYSLLALCHESQSSIDYELPSYRLQNEDTCSRYLLLWNKLSPSEISSLGSAHRGELISASGRVSGVRGRLRGTQPLRAGKASAWNAPCPPCSLPGPLLCYLSSSQQRACVPRPHKLG